MPSALRVAEKKEDLSESEEESAEASLKEERAAIEAYKRRRRGTHGRLRAAFDHAIPEERDHARMFEKALKED